MHSQLTLHSTTADGVTGARSEMELTLLDSSPSGVLVKSRPSDEGLLDIFKNSKSVERTLTRHIFSWQINLIRLGQEGFAEKFDLK
jgi:hypothetical protein